MLLERGFVLHQRPYRDSSQLLECMTGAHGRMGLVARGSRRAATRPARAAAAVRAAASCRGFGAAILGGLTHVEADGASYALEGQRLLAGFYASELLLRLTARGDPNREVFSCYSRCLAQLGEARECRSHVCAIFELELLRALGYGLELDGDSATGEPLRADASYVYELEQGLRRAEPRTRTRTSTRAATCWRCGIASSTTTRACALRSGCSGECSGRISENGRCKAASSCRTS